MSDAAGRMPVVVLLSGRGSNFEAIARQAEAGGLPVALRAAVSDRPGAGGLEIARRHGIAAEVLEPGDFADRAAYDRALAALVDVHRHGLVVLAGFMRILTPGFVAHYAGRMLNIHPSLLPRHRGLHTHRRVLEAGDRWHGASVHFVTAELDGGPVVLQVRVPVAPDDDEARLAARVLSQEHRIYPLAIGWFASGRLALRDDVAWLDGRRLDTPVSIDADQLLPA